MTFTQNGTTVAGVYSGGTMLCGGARTDFGNGVTTNGIVNGVTVTFDIKNVHNTGTVSGSTMRGTVVTENPVGVISRFPLNGTFAATKQP